MGRRSSSVRFTDHADDERLPIADRFCECAQAGPEDQLAAAGRNLDPLGSQESLGMIGYHAAGATYERALPATGGDPRQVAGAEPGVPLTQANAQVRLDGMGGREGDGEAMRVRGSHPAGEIDDPEQLQSAPPLRPLGPSSAAPIVARTAVPGKRQCSFAGLLRGASTLIERSRG